MWILNLLIFAMSLNVGYVGHVAGVARDDCEALAQPKDFPALNTLLDSVSLEARLRTFTLDPTNDFVISVRLGDDPSAFVAGVDAPTPVQDSVRVAVRASLRPRSKKSPESFRLHLVSGQSLSLKAERSMLCAPTYGGGSDTRVPFSVGRISSSGTPMPMPTRGMLTPTIHIGAAGEVLNVTLDGAASGSDMETSLKQALSGRRYSPALLDGRPVAVKVKGDKVELLR